MDLECLREIEETGFALETFDSIIGVAFGFRNPNQEFVVLLNKPQINEPLASHYAPLDPAPSYSSDMPIASRTSLMVADATRRARFAPASRISQARYGFSSYFFRRSCMGLRICTNASAAQPLHSMQPMPADLHPTSTLAIVARSLRILCKSPTGHTSGLPGSVRRTRAGSVTIVFSFCRTTGSASVSMMVLPYDFDILRPSVPGSLAAGVSSGWGSGNT